MQNSASKKFVLVWLYNGRPFPIMEGTAPVCQSTLRRLKGQPQYRNGKLLLRTYEGFKANPKWQPTTKNIKNGN